MHKIFISIFWFCIFGIVYTYFLYPLLLSILSLFIKNPVKREEIEPTVSLIIAAYNEGKNIKQKLIDSLTLDYPKDKLQIIVVSDASTDNTDEIVLDYKDREVLLVRQDERLGKTAAQNKAVDFATGEILVFSDATTKINRNTIRKMVQNFADDKVGCVGAELKYLNHQNTNLGKARKLYWAYEKFLRRREGAINTLLGVSGCCYAVRKQIYKKLDPRLMSDFAITWFVLLEGYRSVFEPEARAQEYVVETEKDEIEMRARVASRSIISFKIMKRLLNPFKYGFFSVQLFSHKVLRYAVPIFMILSFISTIFLSSISFYRNILYLELFFLILGLVSIKYSKKGALYPLLYFFIGNYSILKGILKSIYTRNGHDVWQPIRK